MSSYSFFKLLMLIISVALLALAFPPAPSAQAQGSAAAYFVFQHGTGPDTFVFKLTDPTKIQQARDILMAGGNKIVSGTIIKRPVYYNAPWSFYLEPKSIVFADFATEVCDASIRYVEANLVTAYPTWCPWNSRLLREIAPPALPGPGNLNPAISMVFPYADNTYSSAAYANVTISAAADDPDGSIVKVEFFGNGIKIGETSSYPYRFNWNNLDVGSYTVLARTTDNLGAIGSSSSITFSVTQPTSNPVDSPYSFVRQHYLDFLSREPDSGGLDYWAGEIFRCGVDTLCIHSRRIGVSAAFFIESEFQETGAFVYRLYKTSFGVRPQYLQFITDRERVVGGVNLETGKQNLLADWIQRADFLTRYPASLTGEQFIDAVLQAVLQGSGVDLSVRKDALLADWITNGSRTRLLQMIADDALVRQAEHHNAFVLMQYFGYLRRDPDEAGYLFWLDVLNNGDPNNYRGMICSFLTSAEYQRRFAPLVTRTNADCAQ